MVLGVGCGYDAAGFHFEHAFGYGLFILLVWFSSWFLLLVS